MSPRGNTRPSGTSEPAYDKAKLLSVSMPNLGLYTDRPAISVPPKGLSDARNVRIRHGKIRREAMGWSPFPFSPGLKLNGRPLLIDVFHTSANTNALVFATPTDLYEFNATTNLVSYLTPRYEAGNASAPNNSTAVTGAGGTLWKTTPTGSRQNVLPGDEISFNATGINDPAATWWPIASVTNDTHLVLGTPQNLGLLVNVAYTIRQKFQGGVNDIWRAATLFDALPDNGDRWYATNGVDPVVKWDGAATKVSFLPALGFTCKWLLVFKQIMIYGNITVSGNPMPNIFVFSQQQHPEVVDGSNNSGQLNGNEINEDLQTGVALGDWLVTYSGSPNSTLARKAVTILQFVGPPLMWALRTIVATRGPVSGRSVVDMGAYHAFVSFSGQYSFDGVTLQRTGQQVFRDQMRSFAPARAVQTIGFRNDVEGENYWVIPLTPEGDDPTTATPTTALTEFYTEDVGNAPQPIVPRDLPATAMGFWEQQASLKFSDLASPPLASALRFNEAGPGAVINRWDDRSYSNRFPQVLFGMADGTIMALNSADDQNGSALSAYARSPRFPLQDGVSKGFLRELIVFAKQLPSATYPLTVIVHLYEQADGDEVGNVTLSLDLTQAADLRLSPRCRARYAEIEVRTDGADQSWEISGYQGTVVPAGVR